MFETLPRKQIRKFTVLSYAGHGANDLFFFILPPVLPMLLKNFGLSYGAAGSMLTAYLLTLSLSSFLSGKISDRISRGLLIGAGLLLASACFSISGFVPLFPLFVILVIFAAIGVSTYHPVMYGMLEEYTDKHIGKMYSSFEFWGVFAILMIYILNGTLLDLIDWRFILIITSIPGFIIGALFLFNRGLFEKRETDASVPEKSDLDSDENAVAAGVVVLFILAVTGRTFAVIPMLNFIPTYFVDVVGLKHHFASYTAGFFFLGGISTMHLFGKASDRWGPFSMILILTGFLIPVTFLFSLDLPLFLYPVFVFLLGSFGIGVTPLQNVILVTLGKRFGRGQIFGMLVGAITFTGAFSPSVLGFLADHLGLQIAYRLFTLPIIAGGFLLLLISRRQDVMNCFKKRPIAL
jgi:MFS transporter, FSR family, fosmidomycin resistance protein